MIDKNLSQEQVAEKIELAKKQLLKKKQEPIKIEAKRISSNKYEILSGLNENDEVINNALFLLDSDAVTNALYESDKEDW